jgi:hypothetical protein
MWVCPGHYAKTTCATVCVHLAFVHTTAVGSIHLSGGDIKLFNKDGEEIECGDWFKISESSGNPFAERIVMPGQKVEMEACCGIPAKTQEDDILTVQDWSSDQLSEMVSRPHTVQATFHSPEIGLLETQAQCRKVESGDK